MTIFEAPYYTQTQIEEMELHEMSFPYNDDYMKYVGIDHQYELKETALNELDNTWKTKLTDKSPNGVRNFLTLVRKKFYSYAYTHSKSSNLQINYLIAKRGIRLYPNMYEYRHQIKDVMLELAIYLLNNGDLSSISGVDIESMTSLSIDTIRYEERDYPQRFKQRMLDLGLAYYGVYRFIANGCGKEW